MLHISDNTVDTQISRALIKLKDDLKDYLITILFIFFHIFYDSCHGNLMLNRHIVELTLLWKQINFMQKHFSLKF